MVHWSIVPYHEQHLNLFVLGYSSGSGWGHKGGVRWDGQAPLHGPLHVTGLVRTHLQIVQCSSQRDELTVINLKSSKKYIILYVLYYFDSRILEIIKVKERTVKQCIFPAYKIITSSSLIICTQSLRILMGVSRILQNALSAFTL